jgi:ubiquinone/menaquinone biosynthesis C-methylase UbiE
LRVFFHLLYHQFAWCYDLVANLVSLGKWKSWRETILIETSGPKILELGFGTGHIQKKLNDQNIIHFGVDESHQMGVITSRILKNTDGSGRIIRGCGQNLPFIDGIFNQVISTFPSEFILQAETLSESFRVLNTGGKIVILPFARAEGNRWFDRLSTFIFKAAGQHPEYPDCFPLLIRQAGFEMHTKLIRNPGWSVMLIIGEKSRRVPPTK